MPAFAYRHVKDLYPVFWGKSCELAKVLAMNSCPQGSESVTHVKNAPVVEFGGWANRATLDIIGVAGMGHDFNAIQDPDNELNRTYRSLFHSSGEAQLLRFLSLLLPSWFLRALPVERNNQLFQGARTIRRVCRQLIDSKKEKLGQTEKPAGVDILSVALGSGGFTEENLVDQMMTFLAAGHETTATAMIWAVYEICLNPGIQSRLRKEIRTNLPPLDDSEASVTAPMFDRLPFLHAVCNEVLRVHAPVPITVREADHDATIQGQFVPAGTRVIIPVWAVNMSKSLWGDDATKFCPDRWMGEGKTNTGGASNNYSFLTFLHGPRSCIGQAFAKAEFACLLAALVGRFEMVLEDPDRVIEIQGGITSKPKEGLPIRMKALDGW